MAATDTITRAELTKALTSIWIHTGKHQYGDSLNIAQATYPDYLANDIFRDAEKHREPEYEDNGVYVDSDGEHWQYEAGTTDFGPGRWFGFGAQRPFTFGYPTRPLRKVA